MCYSYSLLDRYDEKTGTHSMARVTGYTATTALRMIEKDIYNEKGLIVPEYVGKHPECIKYMLKGLEERGVVYKENIESPDI
jgi:saccharopine dehydrogenase-like NADP-dependent oxidoreductase